MVTCYRIIAITSESEKGQTKEKLYKDCLKMQHSCGHDNNSNVTLDHYFCYFSNYKYLIESPSLENFKTYDKFVL